MSATSDSPDQPAISVKTALRLGWNKTFENLRALALIGAVGVVLSVLAGELARPPGEPLVGFMVLCMLAGVTLALFRASLDLNDGRSVEPSRPFELVRGFIPFVVTLLLYGFIVAAGLLLCLVPGVAWAVQFGFAPFIALEGQPDALLCLRESSRLTAGHRFHLLEFYGTGLLVNVLGCLAFGVGLLITIPMTLIAAAHLYRGLQAFGSEIRSRTLLVAEPTSDQPSERHCK